jgi:hypothetical protein
MKCHEKGKCQDLHKREKTEKMEGTGDIGKNYIKNMVTALDKNFEIAKKLEERVMSEVRAQEEEEKQRKEDEKKEENEVDAKEKGENPKPDFSEDLELIKDLKNSGWNKILNKFHLNKQKKIVDIIKSFGQKVSEGCCSNQCGKQKKCGHVCQLTCHLPLACPPTLLCNFKKKKQCACGERIKYIACYLDRQSKVLACEDKCLNLKRFKTLYAKTNKEIKTFYPIYVVRFGKKYPKYLKKLESSFENFFIHPQKESLKFTIPKSAVEKQTLVKILGAKYYKMDLSYSKYKKKIYIQVFRSNDITLPETRLSEYIRRIDNGEVKLGEDNFSINIKFNNIQVYNQTSEVEEILNEFFGKFHVERYPHHMVLCLWDKEDLPKVTKTLRKSGGVFSQFFVEEKEVEEVVEITEVQEELVPLGVQTNQESTTSTQVAQTPLLQSASQEKDPLPKKPLNRGLLPKKTFGKKRVFTNSKKDETDSQFYRNKSPESSPEMSIKERKRQKKGIKFSKNIFDALG